MDPRLAVRVLVIPVFSGLSFTLGFIFLLKALTVSSAGISANGILILLLACLFGILGSLSFLFLIYLIYNMEKKGGRKKKTIAGFESDKN